MEYKLYHENIVQRHHVMLVGWPQNIPFKNLSECSSSLQELQDFLKKLVDGETYWKTITEEELNKLEDERQKQIEDGEIAPRAPRRRRSDYGKKRKRDVPLSEDDEDSDGHRKQKKRKYKSAARIETDEETED